MRSRIQSKNVQYTFSNETVEQIIYDSDQNKYLKKNIYFQKNFLDISFSK